MHDYDRDTFEEMVRDWKADHAPEMDDLEIGEVEEENGELVAYARDGSALYSLTDGGDGNIKLNYLGSTA